MDTNIAMIADARRTLESSHAEDLTSEALAYLRIMNNRNYLFGRSICLDRDGRHIYSKTQVDLLFYKDESGATTEHLIIRSDDTVVFSAEGHDYNDYRTTYFYDDREWQRDLTFLSYACRF